MFHPRASLLTSLPTISMLSLRVEANLEEKMKERREMNYRSDHRILGLL
jgi:hypothetical protein